MKFLRFFFFAIFSIMVSVAPARNPQRGYRGFLDISYSRMNAELFGFLSSVSNDWGISTVHGYQINPMFFAGVGAEIISCSPGNNFYVPVFGDFRADFKFGRFTPYADLRAGYAFADNGGFRFSPSIGYRFNTRRRVGWNLSIGYTFQHVRGSSFQVGSYWDPTHVETYVIEPYNMNGFTVRFGLDF